MKKYIYIIVLMGIMVEETMAQSNHLELGLVGGGIEYCNADSKSQIGWQAGIEFGYTCLFSLSDNVAIGPHVGIAALNAHSGLNAENHKDQFSRTDYLGNTLEYTNTCNIRSTYSQWQVEVPVMASFRLYGIVLQAGVKGIYLPYSTAQQTLSDEHIEAFFPKYGVTMRNEMVSGLLPEAQRTTTYINSLPIFHLAVSGEIGYEFDVASSRKYYGPEGMLSIRAYIDYGLKNVTGGKQLDSYPVIQVGDIDNPEMPVASVNVGNYTALVASKLNYMSFGVRVAYVWSSFDYAKHGLHKYRKHRR